MPEVSDSQLETAREAQDCIDCGSSFMAVVRYITVADVRRRWAPSVRRCPTCCNVAEAAERAAKQAEYDAQTAARVAAAEAAWDTAIPPRYRAARTADVYPETRRHRLEAWDGRGSVYLVGPVGCGKTFALTAMARMIWQRQGDTIACHDTARLLEWMRPGRPAAVVDLIDQCCTVDILLLTDMGAAKPTKWAVEKLGLIVNHRYANNMVTLFDSNVTPDGLAAEFGEDRIASRLAGSCEVIEFPTDSPDRRNTKRDTTT